MQGVADQSIKLSRKGGVRDTWKSVRPHACDCSRAQEELLVVEVALMPDVLGSAAIATCASGVLWWKVSGAKAARNRERYRVAGRLYQATGL
eukprot:3121183-Amphidinium_carterae.1